MKAIPSACIPTFLLSADWLCLAILFNPGDILSALLEYPAQGEEAASRNLWRMLFLILPILQLAGYLSARFAAKAKRWDSEGSAVELGILNAVLGGIFLLAIVQAWISDSSKAGFLVFNPSVLLLYLVAFILIETAGRKLFGRQGRVPADGNA